MITLHNIRTILIATDDDLVCQQLQAILEAEYPESLYCCDPHLMLDTAQQETPDLLFIDADFDYGMALYQELRYIPALQNVPVIMLIASDDDETLEYVMNSGVTDYLVKPIRSSVVRQRVRSLLKMVDVQKALSEKEEHYRIISNTISDFAYGYNVTENGEMVDVWNTQAFETITGYTAEEVMASYWQIIIHPDDIEFVEKRYLTVIKGNQDKSEFRIVTKSGEVRWLLDHVHPVYSAELGRVVRVYGAAQDITDRKRAENLLRTQAEELQIRNDELDAFAHTVAHDLKNPIASMMGFASLVLSYYDRMTDDKVKEYLSLIMESSYKLKDIINSLLMLASASKQDKFKLETLDMVDILNQSKLRINALIEERDAEIYMPESFPCAVGYAPWVEEIWANYLSNAVKYGGEPPKIEIGADVLPEEGAVRYWIIDNGKGLTAEQQNSVFTPFTRFSQAKIEGHGLGLSVVHHIVQKLNGNAAVEIAPNGGCCFSFTLPMAR